MRVNKLSGIVMRAAAILICLVLFSAHLASGMFARYTTGAANSGNVRVAKFNVNVIEQEALTLDADGNGTYKFLVKNNSETGFRYDIKLKITSTDEYLETFGASAVAKACTDVKLNGVEGTPSSDGSVYTFSITDALAPDSESGIYTITFKASDLVEQKEDLSPYVSSYTVPIDFKVSAKGTQA